MILKIFKYPDLTGITKIKNPPPTLVRTLVGSLAPRWWWGHACWECAPLVKYQVTLMVSLNIGELSRVIGVGDILHLLYRSRRDLTLTLMGVRTLHS